MTKDRPLIGINMDFRAPVKGRAPHSYLHNGYYDCVLTAGGLPVILPPLIKEADLAPILDKLDGVILTGGDDLDPRKMGLGPHPSITMIPERREIGRPPALQARPAAQDARPGHRPGDARN